VRRESGKAEEYTRLHREEVTMLSTVSVIWRDWLERSRGIQPDRQVVDALAGTLRLSVAERSHSRSLAQHSVKGFTGGRIGAPLGARGLCR
jgi:hypothetical protein